MSSHEPEPDDEDTGPIHLGQAPEPEPPAGERRYDAPLSVNPRPVHRSRRPVVLAVSATAAVVLLGVAAWAFWPSSTTQGDEGRPAQADGTSSATSDQADARLRQLLPPGYPAGSCESVVPAKGAAAQLSCAANTDPGGPLSATYTLAQDDAALTALFDDIVATSSVVDCPGNIQSPGPWRRNATPETIAGTLVCGFAQSRPTVAWSTVENRMISEVQSGPQGPNLVQLYSWWSSHS
jgi:serine/threonine kinase PknH